MEDKSNEQQIFEKSLTLGIKSRYDEVKNIQFSILSPTEIVEMSVCEVKNTCLKQSDKTKKDKKDDKKDSLENSVYDPRMGVISKGSTVCQTCNNNEVKCVGLFGYIILA